MAIENRTIESQEEAFNYIENLEYDATDLKVFYQVIVAVKALVCEDTDNVEFVGVNAKEILNKFYNYSKKIDAETTKRFYDCYAQLVAQGTIITTPKETGERNKVYIDMFSLNRVWRKLTMNFKDEKADADAYVKTLGAMN